LLYKDDYYTVTVTGSDVDISAPYNTVTKNIEILIDNFLPYVKEVSVVNAYHQEVVRQAWEFNTNTGRLEYRESASPSTPLDVGLPPVLRIRFSEKMANNTVNVTLTGPNGLVSLGVPTITNTEFAYPLFVPSNFFEISSEYCLTIEGEDLAGNKIMSFRELSGASLIGQSVQATSRDFADHDNDNNLSEWYPSVHQGTDEIHCFRLGNFNSCPLANTSTEGSPVPGTTNINDRSLPYYPPPKADW